jgi:sulfur relay (sulfurtransferase) complex TusBCD TusD component (DsrE family)
VNNPPSLASTVILVTRDGMGTADTTLQHRLLRTYLTLLIEGNLLPAAICFYTEGVRLVAEGSPVLDLLKTLESKGVQLIVCSTCLNYFGLTGDVRVGIVGGMPDMIEMQMRAEKVITI